MGDILGRVTGLLGGLSLSGLIENIVVIGLTIFALILGFFSIRYLNRRRTMLDTERTAAIIRSLHYSGVAREVFNRPRQEGREHLLRALRWLFGAAGISTAMYGYGELRPEPVAFQSIQGALLGIIPAAIGLAHLFFSWICSLRSRALNSAPVGGAYRQARRRA